LAFLERRFETRFHALGFDEWTRTVERRRTPPGVVLRNRKHGAMRRRAQHWRKVIASRSDAVRAPELSTPRARRMMRITPIAIVTLNTARRSHTIWPYIATTPSSAPREDAHRLIVGASMTFTEGARVRGAALDVTCSRLRHWQVLRRCRVCANL
jgi:hypothetical protein